jgi:hypothetical protein
MASFKKSRGFLGGAISCLTALSLMVVATCAPLCARAACLTQKSGAGSEAGCHGMTSHVGSSFLAAHAAACQLGDAGLAVVDKTGFPLSSVAPTVEVIAVGNSLQGFGGSSAEVWVSSSPPRTSPSHAPSLILRV